MGVNYVQMIRGETIERENVKIDNTQIVLEKPEIEVHLFRNDDKKEFQIQVMMPESSQLHIVESYRGNKREAEAKQRYQKLLQQLKTGKAKVQIGRDFSIIEQE